MRIVTAFWLVFVTACAASSPPPVAASRPAVDPLAEVIAIPRGACPGMDDHFAMSANAVRQLLLNMEQLDTDHAVALARCQGAAQLAAQRQKQAEDALSHGAWLAKWGFPLGLGVGATVVSLVAWGIASVISGR